ncbi:leucine-rich repeat domain-containing protein [Agromyces mediolanus]|uniref:hypothetical protein n=1 Tax=Agromyces mediolanus TaxID=41986 RepID=UPI003833E50F
MPQPEPDVPGEPTDWRAITPTLASKERADAAFVERHRATRRLRADGVQAGPGAYAALPALGWLELVGGSAADLEPVRGCTGLEVLRVSHVRGLTDASALASCTGLEVLQLYAQPKLAELPSLAGNERLLRVELGMLRGLRSLAPILDAPNLEELVLAKDVPVSDQDVELMLAHPTLRAFLWVALDVPLHRSRPVLERTDAALERARSVHVDAWLAARHGLDEASVAAEL